MKASTVPVQRPRGARLLIAHADGSISHEARSNFADHLHAGDLLIANDAATLPASLHGVHQQTGSVVEVRLAGRLSLDPADLDFTAIAFGDGDFRQRTEDRPPPPKLRAGDRLELGPLRARILGRLGHPRLISLRFEGSPDAVWAKIARHGAPIQYAYLDQALALWDVWTRIAARPVAFEAPSAGFLLNWRLLALLEERGVSFASVTLAAGISSTGDPELDGRLPFDEPYEIPEQTVAAIRRAKRKGGRVIAIGTTVVRALESAAADGLRSGAGLATGRLGPESPLRVVDALVTGTHEPDTSHYQALHAFAAATRLRRITSELEANGYLTHEFGDSVLLERQAEGVVPPLLDSQGFGRLDAK